MVCILLKVKASRAAQVAKNAPVVTSDMLWGIPCNRCWKVGRPCFPRTKGGQALSTCAACYGVKMSCKTSTGVVAGKKEAGELEAAVLDQEEPEATVPEQEGKMGGTEDMPGRAQRPQRTAMVQARAHLEKYHKPRAFKRDLTDIMTVPASMLFGRKHPTANDHPTSRKHTCTAEAEDQTHPTNTPTPLFLHNSEELTYPDQDEEQPEEALQQPPNDSINFSPISMPATPVAPMSHTDDESSGLLEYEMSSEG